MTARPAMQIEGHDLTFRYPGVDTVVFDALSFRLNGPGFNALFGPSGVGKTSLARMLTGELQDYTGRLKMTGIAQVLYTYNTERLPGWAAVGKHLERITPPQRHDLKDRLVELFDMTPHLGARFARLSLGQKNRINLIRYLLQDFQMLIMDESLANVDEPTREKILLGVKALFPDRFFLYISHNVIEVARFCKSILVMAPAGKDRPAVLVSGQDYVHDRPPAQTALERTMLEIMNAA